MINMNISNIGSFRKKLAHPGYWVITGIIFAFLNYQWIASAEWEKPLQPSLAGGSLTCLAIHPADPAKFLVASQNQIFENSKESSWQLIGSPTHSRMPIHKLISFPTLPNHMFALTSDSIFIGNLKDRTWQRIYKDTSKKPLSFTLHPQDPNHWFLGTTKGLWESRDAGKTWSHSIIFSLSQPVPLLFFDQNRLFIASNSSLYLVSHAASKENSLEKTDVPLRSRLVFQMQQAEQAIPVQDLDISSQNMEEESFALPMIHDIIRARGGSSLFLATLKGVFESLDGGYHWTALSQSGLQNLDIRQLVYSKKENRIFSATDKGVYAYEESKKSWQKLFEGLARDKTQSIALLNESFLIAITEEGFVQYPLENFKPEINPGLSFYQPPQDLFLLFRKLIQLEPTAREIQKKVIRYADVSNGKIKRWHMSSRLAGLLPTISYGRDFSSANNIDLDRGGTNDPDRFIYGPNDTSRGWDARVGWDLGDAIYSSDQTSIDSREKLMVELRSDLLSEATRIYYERRRLQITLLFNPATSEQTHLENLLRMDELTSLLDGMTNGFLSKRLGEIYDRAPELNALWIYVPQKSSGSATLNAQCTIKKISSV